LSEIINKLLTTPKFWAIIEPLCRYTPNPSWNLSRWCTGRWPSTRCLLCPQYAGIIHWSLVMILTLDQRACLLWLYFLGIYCDHFLFWYVFLVILQ
jgi:hypothetical protein